MPLQAFETVRNLGVIIDQHLTFEAEARACSKACFYHLRRIRQIKRFTDDSSLQLLVQAFTTTRLDYCNGLLADCSVAVCKRFQRIQDWFAQSQLEAMLHHYYIVYIGCQSASV